MVSWGWIPVAFIVGGLFGTFLTALIAVSREENDDNRC